MNAYYQKWSQLDFHMPFPTCRCSFFIWWCYTNCFCDSHPYLEIYCLFSVLWKEKKVKWEYTDLLSPSSAFYQPSNEFLGSLAFQIRTYITGKGPFSMSLKFIVAFGNVIPQRNVKVKLKICLFSKFISINSDSFRLEDSML